MPRRAKNVWRTPHTMKKRDIIIIAAILVLAAAAFGIISVVMAGQEGGAEDFVYIYVNDQLYEADPLNEDKVIEIDQGNGVINHVEIKDGQVRMLDSSCGNQNCVGMGSMSKDNPGPMFNFIVCLPHQVSIELRLASEEQG